MPSERSLRRKLSALGFKPRRVAKRKPLRKVPQTEAIFETVHRLHREADEGAGTIRLSLDTKTVVPIGQLSRGGKSRPAHQALDHDLEPDLKLTPRRNLVELYHGQRDRRLHGGPLAGDLAHAQKNGHPPHALLLNAGHGPENNGARTQWLKRLVGFSAAQGVTVKRACYPPYPSKDNPVERVFGVLENYWHGEPLCTVSQALGMAEGMTYKGVHPQVRLIEEAYAKGVRLTKKQMKPYEACLERLTGLGKWFITITAEAASRVCSTRSS